MNELELLQEAFRSDEPPSEQARHRARTALLNRTAPRRNPRWAVRATAVVTAVAAVALGVVVVQATVTDGERPIPESPPVAGGQVAAPPYAKPAGAAEFLENVAWTAARKPWVDPRPDQYTYVESTSTVNRKEISDAEPNGALVPGQTETLRRETWWRADGQVYGVRDNGGQVYTREPRNRPHVAFIPYADLAALDTPEKFEAWNNAPKTFGLTPWALLSSFALPPAVEAAVFRWLARQPDVTIDQNARNFDGRPAIALTIDTEGYLHNELLFDPQTYTLIGDRMIAYADHVARADDGTRQVKAGDVFRVEVLGRRGIVDRLGDTP